MTKGFCHNILPSCIYIHKDEASNLRVVATTTDTVERNPRRYSSGIQAIGVRSDAPPGMEKKREDDHEVTRWFSPAVLVERLKHQFGTVSVSGVFFQRTKPVEPVQLARAIGVLLPIWCGSRNMFL